MVGQPKYARNSLRVLFRTWFQPTETVWPEEPVCQSLFGNHIVCFCLGNVLCILVCMSKCNLASVCVWNFWRHALNIASSCLFLFVSQPGWYSYKNMCSCVFCGYAATVARWAGGLGVLSLIMFVWCVLGVVVVVVVLWTYGFIVCVCECVCDRCCG